MNKRAHNPPFNLVGSAAAAAFPPTGLDRCGRVGQETKETFWPVVAAGAHHSLCTTHARPRPPNARPSRPQSRSWCRHPQQLNSADKILN